LAIFIWLELVRRYENRVALHVWDFAIHILAGLVVMLGARILKLEITESTIMGDRTASVEMLQQIKSLGISLAIDDFGTGYSSLSYLHRFPLDTLKIDRSFISHMDEGEDGTEIARTILPMASNLHLDVVAEGVETFEQLTLLRKLECKYGQGFYFSAHRLLRSARDWL